MLSWVRWSALLEWRASLGKRAKGRQGASILGSRSAPRLSRSCPPVPFIPPRGETPRPAAQSETDVGPRDGPLGSVSGLGLGTLSCVKVKQPGYDAAGVLPVGGAACPPRCPAALWPGAGASPDRSRPPGGSRTVHPQHVAVLVSGAARTSPPRKGTGRKSHPRSIHCPWSFRWAGNVHTRFMRPTSPRPRARRGPHRHTKPRASVLGERRTSPRQTPQHANHKPRIERTHSGVSARFHTHRPVDSTPPKTASTPRARQGCRAQNRHSEIRHFYGQIATPLTVALKRTKRPGVRLSEEAGDGRPKRQPAGSAVPRRPVLRAGPRAPRAETSRLLCPVSTPSRGFHEPTAGLRSHAAGSGVARCGAVGPWNVPRGPAWF